METITMKTKLPAIVVYITILFPVLLTSTLVGQTVKEDRSVSDFNRVSLAGVGKIILTQGEPASLTVEADKDLLPEIETEVRGSTLYLDIKNRSWRKSHWLGSDNDIKYYVTTPKIQGVSVSGSGSLEAEKIKTNKLKISISGSGVIELGKLNAKDLRVSISGSGDCRLAGKVGAQDISISGSGSCDARNLRSDETTIRVSGSGNATVWVERDINVGISGSGAVEYKGNPEEVSFQSSGSGKVRKISGGDD